MKKLLFSIVSIFFASLVMAQAPSSFKYQAVVRDATGMILGNQAVGMQISLLQTSPSGTLVYRETFAPTSNPFGLVNLEIGTGNVVTGDFSSIDWSAGPYFIETALDATGGMNYTVMGAAQLLSVPYALHANTAETADYNNLSNTPSNLSEFNNDTGFITDPDDADADPANEIQSISRDGLIVVLSDGGGEYTDSVNVYIGGPGIEIGSNVVREATYAIGDTVNGGIVFWLDDTGEHGLVAALTDQGGSGTSWYNGTLTTTAATGDGIKGGQMNSLLIVAEQKSGTYAAKRCTDLVISHNGTDYGNWYLPSRYELNLLYEQKDIIGGFVSAFYWSSTEVDSSTAWFQSFTLGFQDSGSKISNFRVRAISAF